MNQPQTKVWADQVTVIGYRPAGGGSSTDYSGWHATIVENADFAHHPKERFDSKDPVEGGGGGGFSTKYELEITDHDVANIINILININSQTVNYNTLWPNHGDVIGAIKKDKISVAYKGQTITIKHFSLYLGIGINGEIETTPYEIPLSDGMVSLCFNPVGASRQNPAMVFIGDNNSINILKQWLN